MEKSKRFAALALCGSLATGCSSLHPVTKPVLPDDCVWVEFPYGYICLQWEDLVVTGSSSSAWVFPHVEPESISSRREAKNE